MKGFMETWGAPVLLIAVVLCCGVIAFGGGCEHAKQFVEELDVAVCYFHPEYGKVCVEYDGKVHLRLDIVNDPQKLAQVKDWLKDKLPEGVTLEPATKPAPAPSSGPDPPK